MWLETGTVPEALVKHLVQSDSFEVWRLPDAVGYQAHVAEVLEPHVTVDGPTAAHKYYIAQQELREAQHAVQAAANAREHMLAAAAEAGAPDRLVFETSAEMLNWIELEIESRAGTVGRKAAHKTLRAEQKRLRLNKLLDSKYVSEFVEQFGQSKSSSRAAEAEAEAAAAVEINLAAKRLEAASQQLQMLLAGNAEQAVYAVPSIMQQRAGSQVGDDAMQVVHSVRTRAKRLLSHALDDLAERAALLSEARNMFEESLRCLRRVLSAQLHQGGKRVVRTEMLLGNMLPAGGQAEEDCAIENEDCRYPRRGRQLNHSEHAWMSTMRIIMSISQDTHTLPLLPLRIWERILELLAPRGLEGQQLDLMIQTTAERVAEYSELRAELLRDEGLAAGLALRQAATRAHCYKDWLRRCSASSRRFMGVEMWQEASVSAGLVFDSSGLQGVPDGICRQKAKWAPMAGLFCLAKAWWPNPVVFRGTVKCGVMLHYFHGWKATLQQRETVACAVVAVVARAKHIEHAVGHECSDWMSHTYTTLVCCATAFRQWHANIAAWLHTNGTIQDALRRLKLKSSRSKHKARLLASYQSLGQVYLRLERMLA